MGYEIKANTCANRPGAAPMVEWGVMNVTARGQSERDRGQETPALARYLEEACSILNYASLVSLPSSCVSDSNELNTLSTCSSGGSPTLERTAGSRHIGPMSTLIPLAIRTSPA